MSQLTPITHIALTDSPFPPDDEKAWQTNAKTASGIYIWEARDAKADSVTAIDVVYQRPEKTPEHTEWVSLSAAAVSEANFSLLVTRSKKLSSDDSIVKISIVKDDDRVGGANWVKVSHPLTRHSHKHETKADGTSEYLRYQTQAMLKASEKSQYNVGDWVDAMDTRDLWCVAIIREIEKGGKRALIHYEGWADKWDVKVDLKSGRIAPYRTHTKGETGWLGNARGYQLGKYRNEFNAFLKECDDKLFKPMSLDVSWFPPTNEELGRIHSVRNASVEEFSRLENEMCTWILNLTNCVVPDPSYLPLVSSFFSGFLTYFARALSATIVTHGAIRKELLQAATACFGVNGKGEQMFFGKYGITDQLDEDLSKLCKGEYAVRPPISEKPSSAYFYKNVNVFGEAGGFEGLVERFCQTLNVCKAWVRESAASETKSSVQSKVEENRIIVPDAITLIPSYLVLLSALSKYAKNDVVMDTVHQMNIVELLPWRFAAFAACPGEARDFEPGVALKLLETVGSMLKPFVSSDGLLELLERSRLVLGLSLALGSSALLLQLAGVRIIIDMSKSVITLPETFMFDCETHNSSLCVLSILERTKGSWTEAELVTPCDIQVPTGKQPLFNLLSPHSQYSANFLCSAIISSGLLKKLLEPDAHLQLFALSPAVFDFIAKCGTLDANNVSDTIINRLLQEHVSSLPYVLNVLKSFSQSLLRLMSSQHVKAPSDCTRAAFESLRKGQPYSDEALLQAAFCERPVLHAGSVLWLRLNAVCMENLKAYEAAHTGEAQKSVHSSVSNLLHPDVLSCLQKVSLAWIPQLNGYVGELFPIVDCLFPFTGKNNYLSSALFTFNSNDNSEHPFIVLTRVSLGMTPLLWQLAKLQSIERAQKFMSDFSSVTSDFSETTGSSKDDEKVKQVAKACKELRNSLSVVPKSHEVLIEMLDSLYAVDSVLVGRIFDPEEKSHEITDSTYQTRILGSQLRESMVWTTINWLNLGENRISPPSKEELELVTFDMLTSLVCGGDIKSGRQILFAASNSTKSKDVIDLWRHHSELRPRALTLLIDRLFEQFSNKNQIMEMGNALPKVEATFFLLELVVRSATFHELASEAIADSVSRAADRNGQSLLKTSHISDVWKVFSTGELNSDVTNLARFRFFAWIYRVLLKSPYIATLRAPDILKSILKHILESYQYAEKLSNLTQLEFRCIEIIFAVLNNVDEEFPEKEKEQKAPAILTSFYLRDSFNGESRIIAKCKSLSDLRYVLQNVAASTLHPTAKKKNVPYSNSWVVETGLFSSRELAPLVVQYDLITEVNLFRRIAIAMGANANNGESDILPRSIDSCVSLVVNTVPDLPNEERKRLIYDLLNWCCVYLEVVPEERDGKYSVKQKQSASVAALALNSLLNALGKAKSLKINAGDSVFATWKSKRKLYPARVKEVNYAQRTCWLLYDDGTHDDSVAIEQICDEKTAKNVNYAIEQPVDFSANWKTTSGANDDLLSFASQCISKSKLTYDTLLALGESKNENSSHKGFSVKSSHRDIDLIDYDKRDSVSPVGEGIEKIVSSLLETLPPPVSLKEEVVSLVNASDSRSWENIVSISNIPKLSITLQTIRTLMCSYGHHNDVVVNLSDLEKSVSRICRELCPQAKNSEGVQDDSGGVVNVTFIAKLCASGGLNELSNLLLQHFPKYFLRIDNYEEYDTGQHDTCIQLIDYLTGIVLVADLLFSETKKLLERVKSQVDYNLSILEKAESVVLSARNQNTSSNTYDSYMVLLEACLTAAARKGLDGKGKGQPSAIIQSASRSTSRILQILDASRLCDDLTFKNSRMQLANSSHCWVRLLSLAVFAASIDCSINQSKHEATPFVTDLVSYVNSFLDPILPSLKNETEQSACDILKIILTSTCVVARTCAMIATKDHEGVKRLSPHLFKSVQTEDLVNEPLDRLASSLDVAAGRYFAECISLLHNGMARCDSNARLSIATLWIRALSFLIRSHPPLETFSTTVNDHPSHNNAANKTSAAERGQKKYDFVLYQLLNLVTEVLLAAGSPLATEDISKSETFVQQLRDLRSSFALEYGVLAHLLGPGLFLIDFSPVISSDMPLPIAGDSVLLNSPELRQDISFGRMKRALSVSPIHSTSTFTEKAFQDEVANSRMSSSTSLGPILSDLEKSSESKSSSVNPSPQCKSSITRQAAFRLIWFLISDDSKCIDFALQRIAIIHSDRPQAYSDKITFNFAPSVPPRAQYNAPAGLRNLGATCFANSVLQQVCSIPDFVEGLLMIETDLFFPNLQSASGDALYQLQRLALALVGTDEAFYNPRDFFRSNLKMDGQKINTSRQEDAEGFLQCLLDTIDNHPLIARSRETALKVSKALKGREDLFVCEKAPQIHVSAEEKSFSHEHALEHLTKQQLAEKLRASQHISQVVSSIFRIESVDRFDASVCGHRREGISHLWSIPVEVLGKNSLEAALASSTAIEMVNDLRCSECNGQERTTAKRLLLKSLPKVLVVVLKRFTMDYETFQTVKLSHRVSFPTSLDMYPYTTSAVDAEDGEKDQAGRLSREECQYQLKGVILHRGEISHGHYFSYIRCDDKATGSSWVCADDHIIYPWDMDLNLEADCFGGETLDKATGDRVPNTQSAYVLVYDKVVTETQTDTSWGTDTIAPPTMSLLSRRNLGGKSLLHAPLSLARGLAHKNATYARDKLVFDPSHFAFLDRLLRSQVVDLAFRKVSDRPYLHSPEKAFINVVNLINDPSISEDNNFRFEPTLLELGSDLSIAFSSYCLGLRFLLQTLARASVDLAPTASDIASVEKTAISVGAVANILASPTSSNSHTGSDAASEHESANSRAIASVIDTKKSRSMELFDDSVRKSATSSRTFRSILARLQVWFPSSKRPYSSLSSPANSFNERDMKVNSARSVRTEANVLRDALSVWILRETIAQGWHRDILLESPDYELREIFSNLLWEAYLNLLAIERQHATMDTEDANVSNSSISQFRSLKFAFVDSLTASTSLLNAHWNKAGSMLQMLNRIVSYSAQPCLLRVQNPVDFSDVRGNIVLDQSVLKRVLCSGIIMKLARLVSDGCILPFATSSSKSWSSNRVALPSPGGYHSWTRVTTLLATVLEFCSGLPSGIHADSRMKLYALSEDERNALLSKAFVSRVICLCTSPADSFPVMRILCRTHLLGNEALSKVLISSIIGGIDESGDGNLRSHLRVWNLVARFDDTTYLASPSFGFPLRVIEQNLENKDEAQRLTLKDENKECIELIVEGKRIRIEADADDDTFLILTHLSKQDAGEASELVSEKEQGGMIASLQNQRAKLLVTGLVTVLNQRKSKYWRFTERCLEHLYRAMRVSSAVANAIMAKSSSTSQNVSHSLLPWASDWLEKHGDHPPTPGPQAGLELCKPMDTEAYARSLEMDHVQVQTLVATVAACDSLFIKENIATGMPGGPFWRNQWYSRGKKSEDRVLWYSALSNGAVSFLHIPGYDSSVNHGNSRQLYFTNPNVESKGFSLPILDAKSKNSIEQISRALLDAEEDSDDDDIDDEVLLASRMKNFQSLDTEDGSDSDMYVRGLGRCQIAHSIPADGCNLIIASTNSKWRLDSAADVHQRYSAVCKRLNGVADNQEDSLLALSVGIYIDVRDEMSVWRPGKIVEVYYDENGHQHAIIRFLGFSKESNEDLILTPGRVAKIGQFTGIKLKHLEENQESKQQSSHKAAYSDQIAKAQLLLQRARYPFAHASPTLSNVWTIVGKTLDPSKDALESSRNDKERVYSLTSQVGLKVGLL